MNYQNKYDGRPRGGQGKPYGGKPAAAAPIQAAPIPPDFLERAEQFMQEHSRGITTSKIRRIYSLFTELYNAERLRAAEQLAPESLSALGMVRVRIAYEAGRDRDTKAFVQGAKLLEYLKGMGSSRAEFMKLTQYMEALVAYHKFFGGREN